MKDRAAHNLVRFRDLAGLQVTAEILILLQHRILLADWHPLVVLFDTVQMRPV